MKEGVFKKLRIWSKHSRLLTPATVSDQPEKRARIPQSLASVNPGTFARMLESDGNLETYTELNAVALDLHEPDPETMWSCDLGWVPKPILQEAREKEVTKLQQFDTYVEVPQAEGTGSHEFTVRRQLGREWRTEISLCFARLRVEPSGPGLTLRCYTFGHIDENCAGVGIGTRSGNGRGGHFWSFSSCGVGETLLCHTAI